MLKKDRHGKLVEPVHQMGVYINNRLEELGWLDKTLVEESGISKGHISKLKNRPGEKLTAKTFYSIYKAFGDKCGYAARMVYPTLDFNLGKYAEPTRTDFGEYMAKFETIENSIDIIAARTGIDLQRLKDLYYRKGSLEAYELLLIESAINKPSGEIFNELYG